MADLSLTWTVRAGWADVRIADRHNEIQVVASYISPAPEDFLGAVTRLVRGDAEAHVDFDAEPAVHSWHFHRTGDQVGIRLVAGAEAWSSTQPVGTLARATVRCFDAVAHRGEDDYEREWRRPFPRLELEGLRTAWRNYEATAL